MAIKIVIEKKHLYLLVAIMVFLVGMGLVIAFGSGRPRVHGHDIGEIEGVIAGGGGITITGSCAGRVMVGVDSAGNVICEDDDTGSGSGIDTRCDTSGRCSQVCIGSSCKTSWPSEGLESHPISCSNTCTGACNCITSACTSGFVLTSWSCSYGSPVMSTDRGECKAATGGRAQGSGTCTRIG